MVKPIDPELLKVLAPYVAAFVALLASIGSIIATRMTIKNARKSLVLQLEHDAERRDRERVLDLKRDVYIPLVQAITHAQATLGQISNPDIDNNTLAAGITEDLATMAKIHAVGSEQTIAAMMQYLKVFGPAYLQLMVGRGRLVLLKQLISREAALIDDADSAIKRFRERAAELHIAGNEGPEVGRLRELILSDMNAHKERSEKRAQLTTQLLETQLALLDPLLDLLVRTSNLLPELVLTARRDLDVPLEADAYRQLFSEQQQAIIDAMGKMKQQLRQNLGIDGAPAQDASRPISGS